MNIVDIFNEKLQREFYSNKDYLKVGGRQEDWDSELEELSNHDANIEKQEISVNDENINNDSSYQHLEAKIFSMKRKDRETTSLIGDFYQ